MFRRRRGRCPDRPRSPALLSLPACCSWVLSVQCRETEFLPPLGVEIRRIKPALENFPPRRPLVIKHGEIRRVAAAALGDHVLAENTLENETVTQSGAAGRCVERVAFPFIAPVPERLEHITRQKILGFGGER